MKRKFRTGAILLIATMVASGAAAQTQDAVPPLSIRVTGEARVTTAPDQAEIDVGVITRGDTARRAAEQNARETARVLAELKKGLGAAGAIQTIGYAVRPEYRYPREGGEPQISDYVATNVVRVTISDLDRVGEVVDVAVGAGANRIQRIRFMLKDEAAVYRQALQQAADQAEAEAEALAAALGVRVVRVFSAAEESAPVRPFADAPRTAALVAEMRGRCRIQASTVAEPRTAAVSVYLHPTIAPTTYTGAVLVGFVGHGAAPGYEMNLRKYRLEPSDRPAAIAVAGPVTSQPGQYEIEIAMLAQVPGRRDPRQLSRTISVRVERPEG